MLLDIAPGWQSEVNRGPDWLFVRLHGPVDGDSHGVNLVDSLWNLMQQYLLRRVVVELDDVAILRSDLLGQLIQLNARIQSSGGLLRISGLSDENQEVLKLSRLDAKLPSYPTRAEALMYRPGQPR